MRELQKLIHGEGSWDSKINEAIDYLNKVGKATDSLSEKVTLSDNFHNDGFVALNGVNLDGFYRYVQLENAKLIEVTVNIKGIDLKQWEQKEVARIPDILVQTDTNLISTNGVNVVRMSGNTVYLMTTDSINASQGATGHFLYFKRD